MIVRMHQIQVWCRSILLVYSGWLIFPDSVALPQLTDEDEQLIAWYDRIELENFAMMPLIEVQTGWTNLIAARQPSNMTIHAFLEKDSADEFVVVTLDLKKVVFQKSPSNVPDHQVVRFKRTGLATYANSVLESYGAKGKVERDADPFRRLGKMLTEPSEFFVLARACASRVAKTPASARFRQPIGLLAGSIWYTYGKRDGCTLMIRSLTDWTNTGR